MLFHLTPTCLAAGFPLSFRRGGEVEILKEEKV
jgi:hypothetical protein